MVTEGPRRAGGRPEGGEGSRASRVGNSGDASVSFRFQAIDQLSSFRWGPGMSVSYRNTGARMAPENCSGGKFLALRGLAYEEAGPVGHGSRER